MTVCGKKDEMVNLTVLRNEKYHDSGMQIYCYPTVILQFREGLKIRPTDLKSFEKAATIRKILLSPIIIIQASFSPFSVLFVLNRNLIEVTNKTPI
jgi:hypothetical protein